MWLFATPWTVALWNSPGRNTGVGSHSLLQLCARVDDSSSWRQSDCGAETTAAWWRVASRVSQEEACFEPRHSWCSRWLACEHCFTQPCPFSWYLVITLSLFSSQDQECRGKALHPGPRFSSHLFRNNSPALASRKTCCRCGKVYGVTSTGRHSRTEECHYHFGRVLSHKGEYLVVLFHLFDKPSWCQISRKVGYSVQCVFVKYNLIERSCWLWSFHYKHPLLTFTS